MATKNSAGVDVVPSQLNEYSVPLNKSLNDLSGLIRDYRDLSIAGGAGSQTLGTTDSAPDARSPVLRLTGTITGARTVLWPATGSARVITFWNDTAGSFSVTVKTDQGGSTGVVIPQGFIQTLFHNGTHVYAATVPLDPLGRVPSVRAYHSAAQAVPNNTWTIQSLNSELYDTAAMHDPVTNNSRLTCKAAGLYAFSASGQIAGNATGSRFIHLLLNGTVDIMPAGNNNMGAVQPVYLFVGAQYRLAAGDYVELRLYQDSGVSLNTVAGTVSLAMALIGG